MFRTNAVFPMEGRAAMIMRSLGWSPGTHFETALDATVDWYRSHRSWWEPIKSGEYLEYYRKQYHR